MQPIGVSTHRLRDAALESSARPGQAAPTVGSPRVRPGSPLGFPPLLKGGEKSTDLLVARSIPGVPSKFDSGFKLLLKRWCPLECWDVIRMGMQREEILLGTQAQERQPSSKEAEAGDLLDCETLSMHK